MKPVPYLEEAGWECSSVVEHLSGKNKALGQIPNSIREKEEEKWGEQLIYLLRSSGLTLTALKVTRLGGRPGT